MPVSKASLRGLPINERLQKMQEAEKEFQRTVTVTPTSEAIRAVLSHPQGGGFPKTGGATWPDDGFTLRRETDGDITVERKSEGKNPAPQPEQPEPDQPAAARGSAGGRG